MPLPLCVIGGLNIWSEQGVLWVVDEDGFEASASVLEIAGSLRKGDEKRHVDPAVVSEIAEFAEVWEARQAARLQG